MEKKTGYHNGFCIYLGTLSYPPAYTGQNRKLHFPVMMAGSDPFRIHNELCVLSLLLGPCSYFEHILLQVAALWGMG